VHFGKKLHHDGADKLQGLYSEKLQEWIRDERAWKAMQAFLLEHIGHPLFLTMMNTIMPLMNIPR
jgi:hypothetical protein